LLIEVATMARGSRRPAAALERPAVQQGVAVPRRSGLVDQQAAVAVAVEPEAEVRARGPHRGLEGGGARRSAVAVDVRPVGLDTDGVNVGPEPAEQIGCERRGGAVGSVEDDRRARQAPLRQPGEQVI
jgi:hypothetical protein